MVQYLSSLGLGHVTGPWGLRASCACCSCRVSPPLPFFVMKLCRFKRGVCYSAQTGMELRTGRTAKKRGRDKGPVLASLTNRPKHASLITQPKLSGVSHSGRAGRGCTTSYWLLPVRQAARNVREARPKRSPVKGSQFRSFAHPVADGELEGVGRPLH